MEEQPVQVRGPSMPPIIKYIIGSIILTTLAAWIAQGLLCYHRLWGWCGGEHYVTVAGLMALVVLIPIGLSYRERALRRARRGMWARPGWGAAHELVATFGKVTRLIIEGEWGHEPAPASLITGAQRFERRGWWITVPLDGGRAVLVDRWELWQWLIEVERLRYQLPVSESAIAERLWESRLAGQGGRARWMAYMIILEAAGAVICPTGDPRSRRYIPGDPWSYVEEYEKWRVRNKLEPSETY